MPINRTEFLKVGFHDLSMSEVLMAMEQVNTETPYRYIVTPNVDHVVRLHSETEQGRILASAYARAEYCLCDSRVLAALARFRGLKLPVVTGSDLTERLFAEVIHAGDRIALVGGDPQLVAALERRSPGVKFLLHSPPMGLLADPAARTAAARFVADARARFTFVCVGSPQQELIATEASAIARSRGVALCVGAALDFLANRQKRAPVGIRRMGLEWLHRLCSDPRRLWRRYLIDGPKIFILFMNWRRSSK
jgi:exopolysaccharide biosynthesis WecB/TagA/CpsF family protein